MTRERQILNLLFKNDQKFTTNQIAAQLNVSARTVKTDIKRLNEELEKHSCSIQTKQGVGLWLDYDEEGERFIRSILYEEQESALIIAPEVRRYYLAAELLFQNGYTSMEALANQFYVSKGTVVNDFNDLKLFWEKFGLTFIKKVKYGICVEGSEMQIRLALTHCLKKAGVKNERISRQRIQPLLKKTDLNGIKEIIRRTEERFQYVLTDISFDEFMIQLSVMGERLARGRSMETGAEITEKDKERRTDFVLSYLLEQMEELMDMEFPKEEADYVKTCMMGLRYHVPMIRDKSREQLRRRSPEMFDYMMEIIRIVDRQYGLELEADEELICALFTHLECMVYRIRSKMYLSNPILDSVKREMFYEYEIASDFVSKFERRFKVKATEGEIGYVAFHIGTAIERIRQRKKESLQVAIVCMTGIGTSQFISTKLKRLFPELEITGIVSGNQAELLKPDTQDFVISTIPITLEGIRVVHISPVLSEADAQKIQKHLAKHKNPDEGAGTSYFYLQRYIHEEISILNCDLKSREEAIQLLGNRMNREGYVDEGFVESVLDRERLSGTAIGSLVAIPHAFTGHILKQGIGLMTLQKPVIWGDRKVQLIFMLSLEAKEDTNFQGIFNEVLEITKDMKIIEQTIKARKFRELIFIKK